MEGVAELLLDFNYSMVSHLPLVGLHTSALMGESTAAIPVCASRHFPF